MFSFFQTKPHQLVCFRYGFQVSRFAVGQKLIPDTECVSGKAKTSSLTVGQVNSVRKVCRNKNCRLDSTWGSFVFTLSCLFRSGVGMQEKGLVGFLSSSLTCYQNPTSCLIPLFSSHSFIQTMARKPNCSTREFNGEAEKHVVCVVLV